MKRANAKPDEFPWATAILRDGGGGHLLPVCGGSLIDESWVLTAAHCVVTANDRVIVGCVDLSASEAVEVEIEKVLTHPGFNPVSLDSDIALVKLAQPKTGAPVLAIDDGAQKIVFDGTATAIGWGSDKPGGNFSMMLRKANVPLFSNHAEDVGGHGDHGEDGNHADPPESLFFAGSTNGRGRIGTGDSGGPLLLAGPGGRWVQVAIVSDGGKAGLDRYTRVVPFAPWIRSTLESETGKSRAAVVVAGLHRPHKYGRVEHGL